MFSGEIGALVSSEASTFTDWGTSFTGGAKGSVGPLPTITTTPNTTSLTLGANPVTLTDTAVLSVANSPTGTITFTLYDGNTLVDTETATVNGNGSYTTPTGYALPTTGNVPGTYQWDASYSGDMNNDAASDYNDPNEQVSVSPASPAINTVPSSTIVPLGTSPVTLTDTAQLSGGYNETGTITFTLYQGRPCWTRKRPPSTATGATPRRPATPCRLRRPSRAPTSGTPLTTATAITSPSQRQRRPERAGNGGPGQPDDRHHGQLRPSPWATTAPTLTDSAVVLRRLLPDRHHHLHAERARQLLYSTRRHGQRQRHVHRQLHAAHHGDRGRHLHLVGQLQRRRQQ